jgi:hypothetical protein
MDDGLEDTMELWMGFDEEQELDLLSVDGVQRRGRQNGSRERGEVSLRVGAARPGELRRSIHRYERFEPITVRAAARVLHLQRTGVVSPAEARFYLHELAAMDRHAGRDAAVGLARRARRLLPLRHPTRRSAARRARHNASGAPRGVLPYAGPVG